MTTTRRKQGPRPKTTSKTLKIREIKVDRNGRHYIQFRVEGWHDANGKRRLKQFASRAKAQEFIATESISMLNAEALHTITTRLTPEQVRQAETAFNRLGDRGTLDEVISHYLDKAARPEQAVELRPAIREFHIAKERQGLRPQSLRQLESTLSMFRAYAEGKGANHVHDCDAATVEGFLRSLRAKGGVERATPKTWNNYRADLSTFFSFCNDPRRRWILANPCKDVTKIKLDGIDVPDCLTVWKAARLMRDAETSHGGRLARYFALALFAGIRPGPEGELYKLATHPDQDRLIDLSRGIITIPPDVSKTRKKRLIKIRPALRTWLQATGPEIIPTNADRLLKQMRKRHGLTHDILRHSFISFHVGAFRSIGDAALEAGNSESVIREHYLNAVTQEQGDAFWRIAPKSHRIAKTAPVAENKILRIA